MKKRVLLFALFVLPVLASPFTVSIKTVQEDARQMAVQIALDVPTNHLIYADSFRVTAEQAVCVRTAVATEKPDPFDVGKRVKVYAHPFEMMWRMPVTVRQLTVQFQGCNETTCYLPETHRFQWEEGAGGFVRHADGKETARPERQDWTDGMTVTRSGGYLSAQALLAFLDRTEGKAVAATSRWSDFLQDPLAFLKMHGLLLTLFLVLVGGVLLNLTPCVLPMMPINLAIIGAGAGTRGRGFLLGTAYGTGMVLAYGGTGWILLNSGLFFGALQSSPWFSVAIALIFAALALAQFDVLTLDFTRFASTAGGVRRHGFFAALTAGVIAALLAGACVAPVVLAVLVLAGTLLTEGRVAAQFLPCVLGLGMALPWPFAGAGLSVLPRPGRWMVQIRQAFGGVLILFALYYGMLAVQGFRPDTDIRKDSLAAGDATTWRAKLAQARRTGQPVFVDVWATWCKNCSAMERTTFRDPRVQERLHHYTVIKVQAEHPEQSPAKEMLAALKIRGLPAFIVLRSGTE